MTPKTLQRFLTDAPLMSDGATIAILGTDYRAAMAHLATGEVQAADSPFKKMVREMIRPQLTLRDDGIAIVPVSGVLARKPDVWEMLYDGVEDTSVIHDLFEDAAQNHKVKGILLDVDSPGGFMQGGPELADAIKNTDRNVKPVVTWSGGTMASLAYWIGSHGREVVASRTAATGSIGAFTTHMDASAYLEKLGLKLEVFKNKEADFKAMGVGNTSLTDAHREHIQARVQASFREFKAGVKAVRPQIDEDNAMRGQVLYGSDALKAGLVDRIGGMPYALSVLRSYIRS